MTPKTQPQIRPFSQCPSYEQDEPGEACFRWILQQDEFPDLCSALVCLKGPIHKTPAVHDWDQMYLIFSGTATIHLGGKSQRVTEPSAVIIPAGTLHSVDLQSGEQVQYVYVNRYLNREDNQ